MGGGEEGGKGMNNFVFACVAFVCPGAVATDPRKRLGRRPNPFGLIAGIAIARGPDLEQNICNTTIQKTCKAMQTTTCTQQKTNRTLPYIIANCRK